MRTAFLPAAVMTAAMALSVFQSAAGSVTPRMAIQSAKVVAVLDGDTIKVRIGSVTSTVRVLGIDTPEKFATRTGSAECFGEEASKFAADTLSGKTVLLESDKTQDFVDKYWRLLRHVWISGKLYGEAATRNGYAFRYVYRNPTKHDGKIRSAEAAAKSTLAGVWKSCGGKRKPVASPAAVTAVPSSHIPALITYSCQIPKTYCKEMGSCQEARFYLLSCGVASLDGDKDGTPCESLCK